MIPTIKVLLCVVLVGLLMVWCGEHDQMMRRTGWGVAVGAGLWLIAVALWGSA